MAEHHLTILDAALARARVRLALALEDVERLESALAERGPAWPGAADDPDLVSPCEAAERFGVDVSTVRRWARGGDGRMYGGRWRVSLARILTRISG